MAQIARPLTLLVHEGRFFAASFAKSLILLCIAGCIQILLAQSGASTPSDQQSKIDQQPIPGTQSQSGGSIRGTIRDAHGAAVPGVRVTLVRADGTTVRVAMASSSGAFSFGNLPPNQYRVQIDEPGLLPFASADLQLSAGEARELPIVTRELPRTITTVDVTASLQEIAQEQVKAQEEQRILGFLPNYYTSYLWNAAPMTTRLKFNLATRAVTDPVSLIGVIGVATAEHVNHTFPGYGRGAEGFGKRLGAAYGDALAGRMFSSAIFPTLFHQDPRYFYRGSGSTGSRLRYAVLATFICRGDAGGLEPNYSRLLGSFAAAGISNLYKAPEDRRAGLTLRNGLIILAGNAGLNVVREFISKQLTTSRSKSASSKP